MVDLIAKDCSPFSTQKASDEKRKDEVVKAFLASQGDFSCISLTKEQKRDIDFESPLAEKRRDTDNKWAWWAGRYIGFASFYDEKGKAHSVSITPRFGEGILERLLEQILHIKITNSSCSNSKDNKQSFQLLLALIWRKRLETANKYGLPRIKQKHSYKGGIIKGKLNVRESILPYLTQKQLISNYTEKTINPIIATLIYQAYKKVEQYLPLKQQPLAIQEVIIQCEKCSLKRVINAKEYSSIKYNSINNTWKSLVDMSWQIINNIGLKTTPSNTKKSFGIFLDMAEIWEVYVRSVLKKAFQPKGWNYIDHPINTYGNTFYKRTIIPDYVFEKNDEYLVFDAKYKDMKGEKSYDVDRSDFFQIHSYIQYFQQKGKVIAGGLIYPLGVEKLKKNTSEQLFGIDDFNSNDKTQFIVDGVYIQNNDEPKMLEENTMNFIDRIINYVNQ